MIYNDEVNSLGVQVKAIQEQNDKLEEKVREQQTIILDKESILEKLQSRHQINNNDGAEDSKYG